MILKEVPKRKINRYEFIAKMSLRHGISSRTIDDYMKTLIDAKEIMFDNKLIWKEDA